MEETWREILTSDSVPYIVLVLIAVLYFVLSKLDLTTILKIWLDWRVSKTKRLEELLGDLTLPQPMRDALQRTFESRIFQEQYGISTHRAMRHSLIDLNESYPDTATWVELRRAYLNDYIELVDGQLRINMWRAKTKWEGALAVLPLFLAVLTCILCALSSLALGIYLQATSNPGLPQLGILAEILLGTAWLFALEWWRPRQSAKKINDLLHRDAKIQPNPTAI